MSIWVMTNLILVLVEQSIITVPNSTKIAGIIIVIAIIIVIFTIVCIIMKFPCIRKDTFFLASEVVEVAIVMCLSMKK